MPIMDITRLSDSKVALIDEQGHVEIKMHEMTRLSASEGRQLQLFLERQQLRLLACSGGTPLHRHVKVWKPQDAWRALPAAYLNSRAAIEMHVGQLAPYGSEEGHWCYAGLSLDQERLVVIVPSALLILRQRELLVAYARKGLPEAALDPFALALAVSVTEKHMRRDPDNPLHIGEREVTWWLHFAGPEPTGYDQRDARRKES
jgi:hypothetical protein